MPFASSSNFCNLKNIGRTVDQSRSFENNGSKTRSDLFTLELELENLALFIVSRNEKNFARNFLDRSHSQSQIDLFERDVPEHHYHLWHPLAYLQVRRDILVHGAKIEDRFDRSLQVLEKIVIAKFRHYPVNHLQQAEEIKVLG